MKGKHAPVRDARFARMQTDPRFRRPKRSDTKVKVDERFSDVLQPKKRDDALPIDRFGRRKDRISFRPDDDLGAYYQMDEEDAPADLARGAVELESSSEESDEEDDDENEEEEEEEEDDDDEGDVLVGGADAVRRAQTADVDLDENEDLDAEVMKELDRQAKATQPENVSRGDDTCRLAVVNMDWDYVRARDLFKVFASIVTPTAASTARDVPDDAVHLALTQVRGKVLSVRVYPSDFGRKRMEHEDVQGPPQEIFKSDSVVQADDGEEFDNEALRKYQLERLRYYYAIATFDSRESARHVYNEIDGTEMERSANLFDLRFVPDDMEFPDGEDGRPAEFRDEATEDVKNYRGLDFRTDALRHSKVRLTWDQDDPERTRLTQAPSMRPEDLNEDDIKTYLASASEDEDEDENKEKSSRDRLRSLLGGGGKNSAFDNPKGAEDPYGQDDGDMEITFTPALAGAPKKDDDHEETTIEKYKRKQRERRERRKNKNAAAEREPEQEAEQEPEQEPEPTGDDAAGFDDPFFETNDGDFEAAFEKEFGGKDKKNKKDKKDKSKKHEAVDEPERDAEGAEAVGDDGAEEDAQHFDLHDLMRQEKLRGKKLNKFQKRREAARSAKRPALVQPSFEMNTADPRFSAVMDDHRFAIDPNHPSFVNTPGMKQLVAERNKRQREARDSHETGKTSEKDQLGALVSSVKRNAEAPRKKQRS